MKSLRDEIMNIKCIHLSSDFTCLNAYTEGYKEARHEAAELAIKHDALMGELLWCLEAALEWIDAVPSDTQLPAMPGFDRDEVDSIISKVKGEE